MKTSVKFLLPLFAIALLVVALPVQAQDLSQVENELTTQADSAFRIMRTVVNLIFVLGAIGLVYAFVQKKEDAKTWLISYAIALVVWFIVSAMFL
jgi:uncharacterized BrkB/YihY/UPF0761 family membrane protein